MNLAVHLKGPHPSHPAPARQKPSVLVGHMGVDVQSEACGVIPQHIGCRFQIDVALQCHGRECVFQIAKLHIFVNLRVLQQLFMHMSDALRDQEAPVLGDEKRGGLPRNRLCSSSRSSSAFCESATVRMEFWVFGRVTISSPCSRQTD